MERKYEYGRFIFDAEVFIDGDDVRTQGGIALKDPNRSAGNSIEFVDEFETIEDWDTGEEIAINAQTRQRARSWIEDQWEALVPAVERDELLARSEALCEALDGLRIDPDADEAGIGRKLGSLRALIRSIKE